MTSVKATMILIGQYDSPFVRRVAIAMRLYGIAFEHKPWSTFGDADKIAPYNPLRRVPTLVLDDGEALIESAMILDHLDDRRRPRQGDDRPARRDAAPAPADLRAGDGARRQGRQPAVRARAAEGEAARSLGRALQVADIGRARRAGKGARRGQDAVLVRRKHRPCRYRGRLRAALHRRGASRAVRRALSRAEGAFRALRGAAAVQGNRPAAGAAKGAIELGRVGKARVATSTYAEMVGTAFTPLPHPLRSHEREPQAQSYFAWGCFRDFFRPGAACPGVAPPGGQPRFQAFGRIASGVSGCSSGCALANSGSAIAVSKMRFTVG